MIHLFAYGTLQLPEVFHAVTGRLRASEPATLTGYGRYGLLGLAYPGLIHEPGARTEGLLYRNLTGPELSRLDGFEDAFYQRETLTVMTAAGESVSAEVYVVPPAAADRLDRRDWSLEAFRREHLSDFMARCRAAGPSSPEAGM